MARKKVELTYIEDDSKRKTTFRNRKSGLIKKVEEISTLCGIEACAIIYDPNEPRPEVWPSPWEAKKVISKFKGLPELEQSKKMLNQEAFLKERIKKVEEQLKKQMNDNRKKENDLLMFFCLSGSGEVLDRLSMVDLNDLSKTIDQNLKEINRKIDIIRGQEEITNGETIINEEQAQAAIIQNQPLATDNIINGYWSAPFNP